MAPLKACQYIDNQEFKVKNTFLHSDQADLDDSDWIIRRQASEPAPNRQLSGARKQSLEKCVEADENDNSSDSDLDMDNGLFRQTDNDFPDKLDMDRQTSILSLQGFDKQVSVMSATGLCRQQTEMEWPTYTQPIFNIAFNADNVSSTAEMDSPTPEVEEAADLPQRKVIGLDELVSAPSSENNMQMWPQMNTMMWPMMWPGAFPMDMSSVMKPSTEMPYRNRRKARSLITQAQEQNMRKQKLLWSQNVQLLKRCSEHMPEQQHEELEENFFDSVPEPEQESEQESTAASFTSQEKKAEQSTAFHKQVSSGSSEDAPANQPKAVAQFCPYCGGKVQTRFKFCRYCGHDVAQLWGA